MSTEATPAEPGPKSRRGVRQWFGELSTTVKAAGGIAGAIAAVLALVFLLFPDLRPDPTPSEGSATLSQPTLEQPVTFGQYLDRIEVPRDGSTAEQLAERGALAGLQVEIKGYRGERLPLRWFLLDEGTHEIVNQQSRRHSFEPDRDEARLSWPVWVGLPAEAGTFRIVFEIYPPGAQPGRTGHAPLHSVETEPFSTAPA